MRINIVGTTGSGKSVLAQKVASSLHWPYIELDALFWLPNWTPAPRELFRTRVAEALQGDAWVVAGNYSTARDLIWARADTVVWLDYPLPLVLWRLLRRTVRRVTTREELWAGNRDSFRAQFLSRESLFLYAVKTHYRRRRELPVELAQAQYQHLQVLRFRTPHMTDAWQLSIGALEYGE